MTIFTQIIDGAEVKVESMLLKGYLRQFHPQTKQHKPDYRSNARRKVWMYVWDAQGSGVYKQVRSVKVYFDHGWGYVQYTITFTDGTTKIANGSDWAYMKVN